MITAFKYYKYILQTDEKALEQFKWVGNTFTYVAAAAVVTSITFAQQSWPFVLYLIGSSLWLMAAHVIKDRPLFWLNLFFILLNSYGVWLRW